MNGLTFVTLTVVAASILGCSSSRPLANGTGGSLGAGGGDGSGGAPGRTPDGGACRAVPWPSAARLGWNGPRRGAGGAGGADAGSSGCQLISDGAARGTGGAVNAGASNVVCGGSAWLRPTGGLGGTGGTNIPTITWDDGQVMDWATGPTSVGISAPIADGASARRVLAALKVDYATQSIATMDVRDAQTGQILYMVRGGQGVAPPAPTADDLTALFGVDATADVWCTYSIEFGCATERQTILNHLLHTTPEQVISSDPSQLTTPSGTFSALWFTASSEFTVDGGAEAGACDIGAPDAHVVSFIASRVAGT